jgi:hypothetical protein
MVTAQQPLFPSFSPNWKFFLSASSGESKINAGETGEEEELRAGLWFQSVRSGYPGGRYKQCFPLTVHNSIIPICFTAHSPANSSFACLLCTSEQLAKYM